MTILRQRRCVLWLVFVCTCLQCSHGATSSASGIRNGGTETHPRGLDVSRDNWLSFPRVIQDVLSSIDDRLRSLDTFRYTMKLTRLDFSLEQLVRRLENIETKLGRLETKFDVRMEKVEEVVIGKDIKEEFSNEHLSQRMETLNEKLNSKTAFLDAKIDIRMERMTNKLEMLEREVQGSFDDVLERMVKGNERQAQFEKVIHEKLGRLDDIIKGFDSLKLFMKEELLLLFQKWTDSLNSRLTINSEVVTKLLNQSREEMTMKRSMANMTEKIDRAMQETKVRIDNITSGCKQEGRLRALFESYSGQNHQATREQIDNLTATVQKAIRVGEAKFKELDNDVELYTRKVINSVQELWRISDEIKTVLVSTIERENRTQEVVREQFKQLQAQIQPLPFIEPKLTYLSQNLDKKVAELGATVDSSFTTMLMAQNSFISSCRRIQEEETQIYDILQQMVYEMRNRSLSDIQRIGTELKAHGADLSKALSKILTSILTVGNHTAEEIRNIFEQHQNYILTEDSMCRLTENILLGISRACQKDTATFQNELRSALQNDRHVKKETEVSEQVTGDLVSATRAMPSYNTTDYDLDYNEPLDGDYIEGMTFPIH